MLTGLHLMEEMAGVVDMDPTRMAAQVVSGIGFLGAGTILRFGASIRGLTTAASLWAVGGVGLAVGAGFLSGALITSGILLTVLLGLSRLERAMRKEQYQVLVIEMAESAEGLARVRSLLGQHELEIRDFDVKTGEQPHRLQLEVHVKLLSDHARDEIVSDLLRLEPAVRAHWL
jgi:putative Mg2+ transporter-C (MgtC) family protein